MNISQIANAVKFPYVHVRKNFFISFYIVIIINNVFQRVMHSVDYEKIM